MYTSSHKEWAMSIEGVYDRLAYHGESEFLSIQIADTIRRLPPPAASFTLDRCCFVSVGSVTAGLILPGRIGVHHIEKR